MLSNLCYVLSVARGTRIQYVCLEYLDNTGKTFRREHMNRVTKPYSPMAIIDPRPGKHADLVAFVERGYAAFEKREQQYALPLVIDAFLDGKLQTDFLEMRGAKIAVALETLKHVAGEAIGADVQYLLPPSDFDALLPDLRAALRGKAITLGVPRAKANQLVAGKKLCQLNRQAFRMLIQTLAKNLSLPLDAADTAAFIESRDSLIHTGRFKSQTDKDSKIRAFDEYLADLQFGDRIFARLLDWDGLIIDWRDPSGDTQTSVV